jgi:protein-L-isoaspartate(D-aspartate) O-methyltransferase
VTVGADDIPPAWREQLRPGGRLVVPLGVTALDSLSGHKLLATFDRVDDHFECRRLSHCRFVPLRGVFAIQSVTPLVLNAQADIRLVANSMHVAGSSLAAVFAHPYRERTGGVEIQADELPGLRMWLALRDPDFCELVTQVRHEGQPVVAVGLCRDVSLAILASPLGLPSALEKPAFPGTRHALNVRSFGPDDELGRRLAAQAQAWDQACRPFCQEGGDALAGVRLTAIPAGVPYCPESNEAVIDRPSTRLVFSWM